MKKFHILIVFLIGLTGCIDIAISRHEKISSSIELGDSIKSVLPKLNNAMRGLSSDRKKRSDQYIKRGVRVEIHYARSLRQPDDLTTDDEFTPYVFNDGVLVAIGWRTIGGVKSQGQSPTSVIIY